MEDNNTNRVLVTIINGEKSTSLPEPASYNTTTSTMIDSGTSVSGKMLGSIVRADVRKINMSWNYLENDEWSNINKLFKTEENVNRFINKVRFFDQTEHTWVKCDMFVSDRSAGMWRRDENGEVMGWTGCSIELTEV